MAAAPQDRAHLRRDRTTDQTRWCVAGCSAYGAFYCSTLYPLLSRINSYLMRWVRPPPATLAGRRNRNEAFRSHHRGWRGLDRASGHAATRRRAVARSGRAAGSRRASLSPSAAWARGRLHVTVAGGLVVLGMLVGVDAAGHAGGLTDLDEVAVGVT
jgi:hypothetical protein